MYSSTRKILQKYISTTKILQKYSSTIIYGPRSDYTRSEIRIEQFSSIKTNHKTLPQTRVNIGSII